MSEEQNKEEKKEVGYYFDFKEVMTYFFRKKLEITHMMYPTQQPISLETPPPVCFLD